MEKSKHEKQFPLDHPPPPPHFDQHTTKDRHGTDTTPGVHNVRGGHPSKIFIAEDGMVTEVREEQSSKT